MEWLGQAKINYFNSTTPLKLQRIDGTLTDLRKVCEESTPPCHLNPLLFNGHLQTMWTAVKSEGPPVYYKRKIFEADDPEYEGTFAVDFVTSPFKEADNSLPPRTAYFSEKEFEDLPSQDSKPMLIALHGLSGGSHEVYLRHCLAPLIKDQRWEACVVNSRGCAMHKITSNILFNARATWDCRQVVKWLKKVFPNRPLYGIGFSLGANIMTNVSASLAQPLPSHILIHVVPWRRGFRLSTKSSGGPLESMESGHWECHASKYASWSRSVFQGNGY